MSFLAKRRKPLSEGIVKPAIGYVKSVLHNWTYFNEVDALDVKDKATYGEVLEQGFFKNTPPTSFELTDPKLAHVEFDVPDLDDEETNWKSNGLVVKSPYKPLRSQSHYGQLKLHLSEVILINEVIRHIPDPVAAKFVILYIGFAPGLHLPVLYKMYEKLSIDWILVDPRADDPTERYELARQPAGNHTVTVIPGLMTLEMCPEYKKKYADSGEYVTIFISDIRTVKQSPELVARMNGKHLKENMDADETAKALTMARREGWDEIVKGDNDLQQDLVKALGFEHNMLKFRFPYDVSEKTEWLAGKIYYQLFGPDMTTETRLYVKRSNTGAPFRTILYDNKLYDGHMCYFNRFYRKMYYAHNYDGVPGMCHCYDCSAYFAVIETYYALMLKHHIDPFEDAFAKYKGNLRDIVKSLVVFTNSKLLNAHVGKARGRKPRDLFDNYRSQYWYGLNRNKSHVLAAEDEDEQEAELKLAIKTFSTRLRKTEMYAIVPQNSRSAIESWMQSNRAGFYDWLNEQIDPPSRAKDGVMAHQDYVRKFIETTTPNRGILINHNMGSGKSRTAVISAEALMDTRQVKVLTKKSLVDSFKSEIKKWGNALYRNDVNVRWTKYPIKEVPHSALAAYFSDAHIRKLGLVGHVWLHGPKGQRFGDLSTEDQHTITDQANRIIDHKYDFISYNGLRETIINRLTNNGTVNPFDNCVVIIDEVQNFVNSIARNSIYSSELYRYIRDAYNAKVVLLSATPIVNSPHEIAYIVNMVKGSYSLYTYSYSSNIEERDLQNTIAAFNIIDTCQIDSKTKTFRITLTPPGFHKEGPLSLVYNGKAMQEDTRLYAFRRYMEAQQIVISETYVERHQADPLPTSEEEFFEYFVNDDNTINNAELFKRRVFSSVSYYDGILRDVEGYAVQKPIETVRVPMSDYQFNKYSADRRKEHEEEVRNRGRADDDSKTSSTYRAASRMCSDFATPEGVEKRPLGFIKRMMEDNPDAVDGTAAHEHKRYLDACLATIRRNRTKWLTGDGLAMYSPKVDVIMKKMATLPGHNTLIYSAFKSYEGTAVLAIALEAAGWYKLQFSHHQGVYEVFSTSDTGSGSVTRVTKAPKGARHYVMLEDDSRSTLAQIYGCEWAGDRVDAELKLAVEAYFGIGTLTEQSNLKGELVDTVIITPKSAEGISLRGIRQVHIMDPYWNWSRVVQITGRAWRKDAHKHYPRDEQVIYNYLYLAVVSEEQKATATPPVAFEPLSSDETVNRLALKKKELIDAFQELVKQAAIDCKKWQAGPCYTPELPEKSILYGHSITDDDNRIKDYTARKQMADTIGRITARVVEITIKDIKYMWAPDTGVFYDDAGLAIGKLNMNINPETHRPMGRCIMTLFRKPVPATAVAPTLADSVVPELEVQRNAPITHEDVGEQSMQDDVPVTELDHNASPRMKKPKTLLTQNPKDESSDDESSDEGASDDGASDDGASDDGVSDGAASDDGASDDGASDDGAPNDGASDGAASNDGASDGAASDGAASEDEASDGAASEDAASDDEASDGEASDEDSEGDDELDGEETTLPQRKTTTVQGKSNEVEDSAEDGASSDGASDGESDGESSDGESDGESSDGESDGESFDGAPSGVVSKGAPVKGVSASHVKMKLLPTKEKGGSLPPLPLPYAVPATPKKDDVQYVKPKTKYAVGLFK